MQSFGCKIFFCGVFNANPNLAPTPPAVAFHFLNLKWLAPSVPFQAGSRLQSGLAFQVPLPNRCGKGLLLLLVSFPGRRSSINALMSKHALMKLESFFFSRTTIQQLPKHVEIHAQTCSAKMCLLFLEPHSTSLQQLSSSSLSCSFF